MRNILLAFCLPFLFIVEPVLAETKPTFTPDANVQKVVEAYVQDAVNMAKNNAR